MGLWETAVLFALKSICKIIFRIPRANAEIPVFIKDETFGIPPVRLAMAKIRDPYIAKLLIPPVVVRWR